MTSAQRLRETHLRLVANRLLVSKPATEETGEPAAKEPPKKLAQAYADLELAIAHLDALQAEEDATAQDQSAEEAQQETARGDEMHGDLCSRLDALLEALKVLPATLTEEMAALKAGNEAQGKALDGMGRTQAVQIKGLEASIQEVVSVLKAPVVPEWNKDGSIKAAVRKF